MERARIVCDSRQHDKPPLTVLVGAGASIDLGLLSTAGLTSHVLQQLTDNVDKGFVEQLADIGTRYWGRHFNFEHLLELLEAIDALHTGWNPKNAATTAEAAVTSPRPELQNLFGSKFVGLSAMYVALEVCEDIVRRSADAVNSPHWASVSSFWRTLADRYVLTVLTLNYDTVVEQILSLGPEHQGLAQVPDEGIWRLDINQLNTRTDHRLMHLHSSMHFGDREYGSTANRFSLEDSFHELYWHKDPTVALQTVSRTGPRSQSGRFLAGRPIVTGLHKAEKLLEEPMASYFAASVEQLNRCPRLLVVGYGCEDLHVNTMLLRLNRVHGLRRRVVLVDKVDPFLEIGSNAHSKRQVLLQQWAKERRDKDLSPSGKPHPWRASNGLAAFYWRGMVEACNHTADIVGFLAS